MAARPANWSAEDRLTAVNTGSRRSEFSYDGFGRRVGIVEKNNGAVTSSKKYVWCGIELVQELDALNNNAVTRRFFAEGEQISGANYYITRDHLGSIREMTDSSGVIRARYDYDPYGRRGANQITLNPVKADFGFTGDYFHLPSGLHMAIFRAYDASTGMWLNRDPIGERGGLNQYIYSRDPLNFIDPLGLWEFRIYTGIGGSGFFWGGGLHLEANIGLAINFSDLGDSKLFGNAQAAGLFGTGVGIMGGTQYGVSISKDPLSPGLNECKSVHIEGMLGWEEAVSGSLDVERQGIGGSLDGRTGGGYGLFVAAGPAQNFDYATPSFRDLGAAFVAGGHYSRYGEGVINENRPVLQLP